MSRGEHKTERQETVDRAETNLTRTVRTDSLGVVNRNKSGEYDDRSYIRKIVANIFRKPLDKYIKVWYNIYTKEREGKYIMTKKEWIISKLESQIAWHQGQNEILKKHPFVNKNKIEFNQIMIEAYEDYIKNLIKEVDIND